MAFYKCTTLILLLALAFVGVCSSRHHGHHGGGSSSSGGRSDEDDDDFDKQKQWSWGAAAGLGIIFGILCGIGCLFSLLAWITCSLYAKCRKDRVSDSTHIKVGSDKTTPPYWASQLIFKPELAAGFGIVSDGFLRLGPAQLVRNRPGMRFTDGAKWAVPMSKGRHVFEITWPWGHRGNHAAVGLATEDAPIKVKGSMPLVGSNPKSWGLDIVKRKVIHGNKAAMTCPTDGSYVPDKFLMYVDLEEGTLGYGNDVTYWGEVISGLPKQGAQPLYLMVGASKWQSELSVVYRGSAVDGDITTMADNKPPHHLPPLYHHTDLHAPPMYREMDDKTIGGPVMVMPSSVPQSETATAEDPPPPYSRPPTGCSMRSDSDKI